MKLRGLLYIALPALAIILLNIFLGSIISWTLSICIIACLLYYFTQINIEHIIYQKTNSTDATDAVKAHAAQVIKKYKVVLSFSLLTVIFISSVFCIYKTANPSGSHPWFFNNDYHGISNNGIAFNKNLSFSQQSEDSLGTIGKWDISATGAEQARLHFSNFYEPVFVQTADEKIYTPANNIFPQLFTQSFVLSNGYNSISVKMSEGQGSFFDFFKKGKHKQVIYDITLSSRDPLLAQEERIALPYEDHIRIEDRELTEGKSLFNLLLNSRNFDAGKNESYAVLNHMLQQMGETYLLANYAEGGAKAYSIFPARDLILNGYKMTADGKEAPAAIDNSSTVGFNRKLYVGFHNVQEKAYLASVNQADYGMGKSGSSAAFIFDYPPAYLL
ncbi:MAG: hypothetical protein EOP49_11995, partial [Sphingobacteriales bacterium]